VRHLFSYGANGTIIGTHAYQQASTGLRGWPDHYECDNPNTEQPDSRAWLDALTMKPAGGFIFYECPHSGAEDPCVCAAEQMADHYVEGNLFVPLPTVVVQLSGVAVAANTVVSYPVGTLLKLQISCAGSAATAVVVAQSKNPQVLDTTEACVEAVMANGMAEEIDVYAPAQGMVGALSISGSRFRSFNFSIRGWGS